MSDNLTCPACSLSHIKRNGHTHYGAQNHQCLECGRQFVEKTAGLSPKHQALMEKLLLERLSLRGICRVLGAFARQSQRNGAPETHAARTRDQCGFSGKLQVHVRLGPGILNLFFHQLAIYPAIGTQSIA